MFVKHPIVLVSAGVDGAGAGSRPIRTPAVFSCTCSRRGGGGGAVTPPDQHESGESDLGTTRTVTFALM